MTAQMHSWDVFVSSVFFIFVSSLITWLFHTAKNRVRVRAHIYIQQDEMNKFRSLVKAHGIAGSMVFIALSCTTLRGAILLRAQSGTARASSSDEALVADFRRVEVASISDALEQLTGKRWYMSHRMHPIFTTKFAGFARTVLLKKDEGNSDPAALNAMLEAIDQGSSDSVYVMVVEDGDNIAGMGGLMGTAMAARGYAGAVIDGGVRDVAYLRKIGFPVYATGIVPSTSVHHYRFGGSQIPVTCDGVTVNPGDIVVADSDGVSVVPRGQTQAAFPIPPQMEFKDHSMYAVIEQMKSIVEAVQKFGRL